MKTKVLFVIIFIILVISITVLREKPILLKYLSGSARLIGKPVKVKVYINDKLSNKVKIFHTDKYWNNEKADYYILNCNFCERNIFIIDRVGKVVACANSTNKSHYDIVLGYLFQSDVGAKFSPIAGNIKGLGFKSNLIIKEDEITFTLPALEKPKKINFKLIFDKVRKN